LLLDRRRRLKAASANRLWRRCQAANQALATRHGLGEAGLFRDWVLQPEPELPLQGGLPDGEHWTLLAQMFIRHEDRLARLQRRIDELEASLTQASAADLSSRG